MTDEKLKEAKELQEEIRNATKRLEWAKDNVALAHYERAYGNLYSIAGVSNEVRDVVKTLVVNDLEKQLVELKARYEAL